MAKYIYGDSVCIHDVVSRKRMVNSQNNKWIIECEPGKYRVGNFSGHVPPNMNCIIAGWHFVKGRIKTRGIIKLVPGNGQFLITGNIIEN